MLPLNYSANVKIPFNGWFGANGFDSEQSARAWIARMYRDARSGDSRLCKPPYASRSYIIRPYILCEE